MIGDRRVYQMGQEVAGVSDELLITSNIEELSNTSAALLDVPMIDPSDVTPGQVSAEAGRAVLRVITVALDLARIGGIEELCFAPIHKQALRLGGNSHGEEIHLFAEKLGVTGPVGEINKLDALGLFGRGEIEEIRPAIEEARAPSTLTAPGPQTRSSVEPSIPSHLNLGIKPLELNAGIFGPELPVDTGLSLISVLCPSPGTARHSL